MGWRERFGGDDERAQIAARARELLDTTGIGPSAGPVVPRDPGPVPAGRVAPPWPAAPGTGGPVDRVPPPLTSAASPPRRGGWVPSVAVLAGEVSGRSSSADASAPGRHARDGGEPAVSAPAAGPPGSVPGVGLSAHADLLAGLRRFRGADVDDDAGSAGSGWSAGSAGSGWSAGSAGSGWSAGSAWSTRGGGDGVEAEPVDRVDGAGRVDGADRFRRTTVGTDHDPADRGAALRALRDRVRWDPGRRGLVAVAAVVVVVGSVAGGLLVRGGTSAAVTVAAASGAAPSDAPAAPVTGGNASTPTPAGSAARATSSATTGTVTVDVAGLVVTPGVYTLPRGSRVQDALAAAGGAQPGADLSTLNRARVLVDGEQLAVGVPGAPAGGPAVATRGGATGAPAGLVDLNTAGPEQLDALPGVGPVLAQAIIAWRTDHGRFASVDDLDQVSGIGPSTLADLRDLVTV